MEGKTFDNSHKETQEALDWFRENLEVRDGVLYWLDGIYGSKKRSTRYVGKPAGCISFRGYIQVRKGKDKYMAHRILWALHYGSWPKAGIDHINGDRLDNRIDNMRDETQFLNSKNAAKYPRREPWIATGVGRTGDRWYASAQVDKKAISLGRFNCHTAAMFARKKFDQENGFSDRHGAAPRVY